MKSYGPYLLFQIARFGALTVPQMLHLCQGKCKRSSLYRALDELVDGGFVYPILNAATRTRGYYATLDGRRFVFGKSHPLTTGVKAYELDHTIKTADILLKLSQYSNVTGIATHFELNPEDIKRFCHNRIPDGILRLTQNGQHFELAVEVEASIKDTPRVKDVLESYHQSVKRGLECKGVLIVTMDSKVHSSYTKAIESLPSEFQPKVKLLFGKELSGIRTEAFGELSNGVPSSWELIRTSSQAGTEYASIKSTLYLLETPCETPISATWVNQNNSEVFS